MSKDFAQIANDVISGVGLIREGAPDAMKAFAALSTAATATHVIDTKTKDLMALAIRLHGGRASGRLRGRCAPRLRSVQRGRQTRIAPAWQWRRHNSARRKRCSDEMPTVSVRSGIARRLL